MPENIYRDLPNIIFLTSILIIMLIGCFREDKKKLEKEKEFEELQKNKKEALAKASSPREYQEIEDYWLKQERAHNESLWSAADFW